MDILAIALTVVEAKAPAYFLWFILLFTNYQYNSPPEFYQIPIYTKYNTESYYENIRSMLVQMEYYDDKHFEWRPINQHTYVVWLNWIQYYQRVLVDAPPYWHRHFFPSKEVIDDAIEANAKFIAFLEDAILTKGGDIRDKYDIALTYCKRVDAIYCHARTIHQSYSSLADKRLALQELRLLLGVNEYWAGYLPPPIPYWQFRAID